MTWRTEQQAPGLRRATLPTLSTRSAADMLIVHRLPEWPAAGMALVRLAVVLSGKAGIGHESKEVKAVCLDLWGTFGAQMFFEARTAEEEAAVLADLLGAICDAAAFLGACPSLHTLTTVYARGTLPAVVEIGRCPGAGLLVCQHQA